MTDRRVLTLWNDRGRNEEDTRVLRTASKEVPVPFDAETRSAIAELVAAFVGRNDASGLAAPQIGIGKRLIVFRNKGFDAQGNPVGTWTGDARNYDVLVNPRITQARGEQVVLAEGCLSCPEVHVEVPRFPEIKVRAWSREGRRLNLRYTDFIARICQHELDHLDGKLIVDYEGPLYVPKNRQPFFDELFR